MAHPDNTMRALKDLPLFVERWQCRFRMHRWERWSDAEKGTNLRWSQHRRCVDCGRIEIREVLGESKAY